MRSALLRIPLRRCISRRPTKSPLTSTTLITQLRTNMSSSPPAQPDEALLAEITSLGDTIRQLKLSNQPFAEEVAKLKELKGKLPSAPEKPKVEQGGGKGGKGSKKKGLEAHGGKLQLKVPKGTKDFLPHETTVRKKIFSILESTFVAHGASTIDTPVFELKDILSGKYGEDSKLIYDLQDQGGELCSLRYDLTVPFARFLAMNQIQSMKRYHIAKVYRRDQPVMSKGRLREFYQCDIDIAGTYDPMVPDAEVLVILCEVLTKLEIGEFTVKINHRKILDGIFAICGVPEASTRAISSAVDKLDKSPWSEVRREMIEDKNLDPAVADKIGEYVILKGRGPELLAKLEADAAMTGNKIAAEGLKDMKILFDYLEVFGVLEKMSFDLSLARGLDYYTGIIYEAITEASAPPSFVASNTSALPSLDSTTTSPAAPPSTSEPKKDGDEVDESSVGVGSIAAGGRYDNLVGMFSSAAAGSSGGKKEKVNVVPCVGVSVGVERVYAILMAKEAEKQRLGKKSARGKETEVYVMSVGNDGLVKERMQICKELWDAGIKAEFMYKVKPKLQPQFETVDRDGIPFAVIIGANELKEGVVRVKDQNRTKEELEKEEGGAANGRVIKREELIGWLKERIASL